MAKSRLCSIPNCGKPHKSRGWCAMHYAQWQRNGVPETTRASPIDRMKFVTDVAIPYKGDDCLEWPYCKSKGYGVIQINNRQTYVSRVVCEAVHGAPPDKTNHAAHSCGNGHLGCVTPNHLSWKTPQQNAADKIGHGTHSKGENNGGAKLTENDVREIRGLLGGVPQWRIAKRFGVCQQTISNINRGLLWGSTVG